MGSCYSKDNTNESVFKTPSLEDIQRPIPQQQKDLPPVPPPVPARDPSTFSIEDVRRLIANRDRTRNQIKSSNDSRYSIVNQLSSTSLVPRSNSEGDCVDNEPTHQRPKFELDHNANPPSDSSSMLQKKIQKRSGPRHSNSSTLTSCSSTVSKKTAPSMSNFRNSSSDINHSPSSDTVFFHSSLDCQNFNAETRRTEFRQKGKSQSQQIDMTSKEPLPYPRTSPISLHLLMRLKNDNDGNSSSAPSTPKDVRERTENAKKCRKPIPAPRENRRPSQQSLESLDELPADCKTPRITPRGTKHSTPSPKARRNSRNLVEEPLPLSDVTNRTVPNGLGYSNPKYTVIPDRNNSLNKSLPVSQRRRHPSNVVQRRRSKSKDDLRNASDDQSSCFYLARKPNNHLCIPKIDLDTSSLDDLIVAASQHDDELRQIIRESKRVDQSLRNLPAPKDAYDDGYYKNLKARNNLDQEQSNNQENNSTS